MSIPPHRSFANNLPMPTRFIQPAANGSSRTVSWIAPNPVSGTAFCFAGDVVVETSATGYLLDWSGAVTVQHGTFGRLTISVRDDTGATVYSGSTVAFQEVMRAGRRVRFVVTGDLVAGVIRVFVDGHLILDDAINANSGAFSPGNLAIGTRSNRTVGAGAGRRVWRYMTFDTSYSADGSAPVAPLFDLRGDAATVNAHPWRYTGDSISAVDAVEPDPLG